MKALLIALIALVVAVVAGHYVAADAGFIVIGYGGKVIRTTFAFFLLVMLLGFIAVMMLLSIMRNLAGLRGRLSQWSSDRRQRRAQTSLTQGLVAMAGGEFAAAERLFKRGLDDGEQPEVYYLAAAEAAQAQGASARRDNYLQLAREIKPEISTELDIKRAQWCIEDGQVDDAAPIIERLQNATVGNTQVLKLRYLLHSERGDQETLLAMVPDLRRDHVLTHDQSIALERRSASALLNASAESPEQLSERWRSLNKNLRAAPEVITAYVRALCRQGADDQAESLLRKHIERVWDSSLAALYGEINCQPPAKQLRKLEAWSMTRAEDPGLRLARARQAIRAGHWSQAREQIEALMVIAPSPLLHQLLAEIAEGMADQPAAIAARRAGLELATGERFTPQLEASSEIDDDAA